MMETQTLLDILAGTVIAGIGWFARQLFYAIEELRRNVQTLEIQLPIQYLRKDEFDARMTRIENMLERISEKLDRKADR